MNLILYERRCKCNEEFSITKKRKGKRLSEGKPLPYPDSNELSSKIFKIRYKKTLSLTTKFILNNLENKYIYYGIDDILYLLKSNPNEKETLLGILYSPILSLQNNFSINFFDIWIREIYIDEIIKKNRFLKKKSEPLKEYSLITIKFFYKTGVPFKKQEPLW